MCVRERHCCHQRWKKVYNRASFASMYIYSSASVGVFIIVLVKATEFRFDKKSSNGFFALSLLPCVFTIFAFVLTFFKLLSHAERSMDTSYFLLLLLQLLLLDVEMYIERGRKGGRERERTVAGALFFL